MSFDLSLVSDTSGESDPLTYIHHLDRRHPGILVGLGISGLFEITTGHVLNAKHATLAALSSSHLGKYGRRCSRGGNVAVVNVWGEWRRG